jgi:hypothetical protein
MPKKSVYFPDALWPRIQEAAELEDRSVSKWISRTLEAALTTASRTPGEPRIATGSNAKHHPKCGCPICKARS